MESAYEFIDNIDDVTVYLEKGNSRNQTDLRTVRDELYGKIDDLLEKNSYGSKGMGTRSMGKPANESSSKANQDYGNWLESIEDIEVEMYIEMHSGPSRTLKVEPRTDFSLEGIQTSPSIMKVKQNGNTRFAVREWTHYLEGGSQEIEDQMDALGWGQGLDSSASGYRSRPDINYERKAHDNLGVGPKTFNMGSTDILSKLSSSGKHFKRNSHDDALYRKIGTPEFEETQYEDGIVMIPELMLESAMHRQDGVDLQLRNKELASPVTPSKIKILDLYDDMAFSLRPWGNNATDGGIYGSENEWGIFYGTMEGMGLVSPFDRKDEFIEETMDDGQSRIKFFDPEFTAYTENNRWFKGADWDNFVRVPLQEHANARSHSVNKIKSVKDDVREDVGDIHLLDEIPETVDRDLFPREKIVETRV